MTGHTATLIHDPHERTARRQAKQERVLRWLRGNTWSTAEVLREVAGLGSRQAIHKVLNALASRGLIRCAAIACEYGPPVRLPAVRDPMKPGVLRGLVRRRCRPTPSSAPLLLSECAKLPQTEEWLDYSKATSIAPEPFGR